MPSDMHRSASFQEMIQQLIIKINMKMADLDFQPNLQGPNDWALFFHGEYVIYS